MRRMGAFGATRLAPRVVPAPTVVFGQAMRARGALFVVAAETKKQEKMDSAVKRSKLAVERRVRNKSRKSAIATRTKKVGTWQGLVAIKQCNCTPESAQEPAQWDQLLAMLCCASLLVCSHSLLVLSLQSRA
jgi:hypothetical protein